MRALIYLPIIHGAGDLGSLGEPQSPEQAQRQQAAGQFWDLLEAALEAFALDYNTVKVYQDGLPVCGKEAEIVADTARGGSRNFRLLESLKARGATVMGTESAELLLEEYALMCRARAPEPGRAPPTEAEAKALLARRDEYIARRIADTLEEEEMGLLFLGMLHEIADKLPEDIKLIQPFGKPKMAGVA